MSEKTKPAPADSAKAEKGGLKKARPEVQALGRITNILDRLTREERDLTLALVGHTYDIFARPADRIVAIDVTRMVQEEMRNVDHPDQPAALTEDAKLAMMRNENRRLREQLRSVQGMPAGSPMSARVDPRNYDESVAHPTDNKPIPGFVHNPKPESARVG